MRDLYLFNKEKANSFERLSEDYLEAESGSIGKAYSLDCFKCLAFPYYTWHYKRGIKLKRKLNS